MKLTEKELAICQGTGAKWVTKDDTPVGLVGIYISEKRPRRDTIGIYNPSTEKVALMDATMFPSLERGACVKIADVDAEPAGDQEDRCPVCGAEIEYDGDQEIVDDGTIVGFSCPVCGAHGKAGYNLVFDAYYDVQKGDD